MPVVDNHLPSSATPLRRFWRVGLPIIATALVVLIGVGATAQRGGSRSLPNPDSSNFMDLDQINKTNVKDLEVSWFYPYGAAVFSPVYVDGVLYGLGRNATSLVALDAATGKELWIHEGLNGIWNKGINFWQSPDGRERRLIFGVNSFLQAVDARTGHSITTFGKNGVVDLRTGLARAEGTGERVQTGSPGRIWRNTLILGSAPGEAFVSPPGDIRAYDVVTGQKLWQFHTVPLPGEFGYETWPKDAYKYVGGANNWGEMSLDEERGIVYIPTGSATYDFYGADRHGLNLFANCLLALDVRTGKRLWHFQTIHHDQWDLDNVSAPQLVTVRHAGRRIDAVAHAGKTGFLYVFNRVTGEALWPIEERPVPKSDAPGEQAWPTQPFPTKPAPFVRQTFTADDVNPWLLEPTQYEATKARVAKARNEGMFTPPGVGYDTIGMPGNQGGSNWGTTAADPARGMVFVVGVNQVAILRLEDVTTRKPEGRQGGPAPLPAQDGFFAYQKHCGSCHGKNLEGATAGSPALVGITERMDDDAIRALVNEGRGTMRAVAEISQRELTAVIDYLTNTNPYAGRGGGGRGAAPVPPLPTGPVVARGGAPRPPLPAYRPGPFYSGIGGNAGNLLYPPDAPEVPSARYMSDYGVMATSTKPPYTTLTAYDLNTGTIKWQIAPGDDLRTVERGGPRGTGTVGARNGIVVTKTGLVFHAGGDNKIRAYDQDTGQVLWTGDIPGSARGIPAMYEYRGRQYLVIASPGDAPGGGGATAGATPAPIAPSTPRGYIAFALPRR